MPSVCLLCPPLLGSRSARPTALRQLRTAAWVGRSRLALVCMPTETIGADNAGKAGLRFHDQSNLDVGPNASVRLNKFIYDPNRSSGKAVLDAAKGPFRFSTGAQGGNRNWQGQDPVWDARHSRLKPAPHCVSRRALERRCCSRKRPCACGCAAGYSDQIRDDRRSAHLHRATYRAPSRQLGIWRLWRCCPSPVQKPKRCFAASLAMAATQQTTEWRAIT